MIPRVLSFKKLDKFVLVSAKKQSQGYFLALTFVLNPITVFVFVFMNKYTAFLLLEYLYVWNWMGLFQVSISLRQSTFPPFFPIFFSKLKSDMEEEEGQDQTWIELQVHY